MTDKEIIQALETCQDIDKIRLHCCNAEGNFTVINVADIRDLINRQQAEIERLTSCVMSEEQVRTIMASQMHIVFEEEIKVVRAEAIKEFAEKFDKVLAEMRDAYFEDDHASYGLVCETVHARLSKFTDEMVGADDEYK